MKKNNFNMNGTNMILKNDTFIFRHVQLVVTDTPQLLTAHPSMCVMFYSHILFAYTVIVIWKRISLVNNNNNIVVSHAMSCRDFSPPQYLREFTSID